VKSRRQFVRASLAVLMLGAAIPFFGCGGGGQSGATEWKDTPNALRIGVIHAINGNEVDVVTKLTATGFFASVAAFDGASATPTPADLAAFDAVVVISDSSFADPTLLGDRLADAIDGGLGVVLSTFTYTIDSPGGRFATDDYFTMDLNDPDQVDGDGPLGYTPVLPLHPLLTGVSTFSGGSSSYRADVSVKPGATLVASWLGGGDFPLIVERTLPNGRRRVDVNYYPPTSDLRADFAAPNDSIRILANALLRVGGSI
jgi:hypothetical protein